MDENLFTGVSIGCIAFIVSCLVNYLFVRLNHGG